MSLVSLRLDTGSTKLHVLVVRRGSEVKLASDFQHFENFQVADFNVIIFLQCDTPQTLCPSSVILDM